MGGGGDISTMSAPSSSNGTSSTMSTTAPSSSTMKRNSSSFDNTTGSTLTNVTTEGWLELFLTTAEKRTFARWTEVVRDRSLTHRVTRTLFDRIAVRIPDNVAPNVITLFGLACLGHAWYVTHWYGSQYPVACTWFAVLNILLFFVTSSVDVRHAENTRQRTALGDLFKYSSDSCSTVFLMILATYCLGGTTAETLWYAVQSSQLVLFTKHLSAFQRNAGLRYNVLTGPGEVILTVVVVLAIRATLGLDWFIRLYEVTLHRGLDVLTDNADKMPAPVNLTDNQIERLSDRLSDPTLLGAEMIRNAYYLMYATALVKTLLLQKPHGWSKFGIGASLLMRFVPAVFLHLGVAAFELTSTDVICDGLFLAVLTSDVTLAKMAGREIHPWVVLMSMAAILTHYTILTLVAVYYIAVFADLCAYLNMPLLTVCRNVYCDGVYDLCHIGHKKAFLHALRFGNRLFVGVVGDKDASSYKRPPIMTHAERCAEVEACKSVTKVIENAPCFGITQEFLDEHQIHLVCFGEEYAERYPDPNDDPYYGYVRKIGIARPLPRTKGLSTSDLIRRIQKAKPADEKNSPT